MAEGRELAATVHEHSTRLFALCAVMEIALTKPDPAAYINEATNRILQFVDGMAFPGVAGVDGEVVKHGVIEQIETLLAAAGQKMPRGT